MGLDISSVTGHSPPHVPPGFRLVAPSEEDGGRRRLRVEVEAASAFFAGHFPGQPILPGIAQLTLIAWGVGHPHPPTPSPAPPPPSPGEGELEKGGAKEGGGPRGGGASPPGRGEVGSGGGQEGGFPSLTEVRNLRLRRPVGPGDVLDLSLDLPSEDGLVRFELRRSTDVVSQGTVRIGKAESALLLPDPDLDFDLPAAGAFPSPAALVPHAPPALLVRSVLAAEAEGAACVVEIPAASPFVDAGRAPAFLGLEAAAQTAAVLESLTRAGDARPRLGYLVGVRDARLHTPWLPAAHPLRATVRLTGSAPPLAVYEAVIDAGGPPLVSGTVSTYGASGPREGLPYRR